MFWCTDCMCVLMFVCTDVGVYWPHQFVLGLSPFELQMCHIGSPQGDLALNILTTESLPTDPLQKGWKGFKTITLMTSSDFSTPNTRGHYKVHNLYTKRKYEHMGFSSQVAAYGFKDHHHPPLSVIQSFFCGWIRTKPMSLLSVVKGSDRGHILCPSHKPIWYSSISYGYLRKPVNPWTKRL